jgi:hypothetical protein
MTRREHWQQDPDPHDFPAAADYLSLLLPPAKVDRAVAELRGAPLLHRKAKDLLRASSLPLLRKKDPEVARDLRKVAAGEHLSPVLLVRGDGTALIIADGYHRVCASYHLDEDEDIPCRLAGLTGVPPRQRSNS